MADSDSVHDLLVRGIAAAKGGSVDEARFFLEWVLRRGDSQDATIEAWWWLSQVAEDPAEKRRCLEEVLGRSPTHPQARRALAVLDGRLAQAAIVDPDRLPPGREAEQVQSGSYACPRCGGRLAAAAGGAWLSCAYCGWRRSLETGQAAVEQDFVVAMATARGHRQPRKTRTFRCSACGAPYMLAPEMLSLTCPYCGSNHVVERARSEELIPPDGVLPFSDLDPKAAAEKELGESARQVRTWLGLYLPMWSFDLSGEVPWKGVREDRQRRTIETVSGSLIVLERDHLVPASHRLPGAWATRALTYATKGLKAYRPEMLAHWPAETYQVPLSDAAVTAHAEVFASVRRNSRSQIPPGVEQLNFDSTHFAFDTFQLILAPVWIGLSEGASPRPAWVVNGQSGVAASEKGRRSWLARLFGQT